MREFLSHSGIPFEYRNIDDDDRALQELMDMGFMSTPVTVIDGEKVRGFDRERLEAAVARLKAG